MPRISPDARIAFFSAMVFGLFCHGTGLFNKLSHQDDIANLFTYGATITSGRWMLHTLSWMEGLLFGTGNTSLPLYNGMLSILCVGASAALLAELFEIRNRVYCALLGALMSAFPVMTALFSYMFTSHPYMIGLLMMVFCAYLVCRETCWWMKIPAIVLGGASIGVYQAFLPVLLAAFLIDDIRRISGKEKTGDILRHVGVQVLCLTGVMIFYFVGNAFFLRRFDLELSSYQGIDKMGNMSVQTFLERAGKAYQLFLFPARNTGDDMYPGTLRGMYYVTLTANVLLAAERVFRSGKENRLQAALQAAMFLLIPLGCNFIYVMSEEVHGLMVYGQVMQAALLISQLDRLEERTFRGTQAVSLAASAVLAVTGVMYARFDNQCYLKETLQQQAAMSYYTTVITQIKSLPGYHPDIPMYFVNDLTEPDPSIYDLEEMNFIHLNLYSHSTTDFIHYYKEFFMQKWNGFEANWYWGEDPSEWPEVQAMPEYPAEGSMQIVRGVLIVKF